MDNVTQFPKQGAPEFMIGPFTDHHVVIEGRLIPRLMAKPEGENTALIVDGRFSISVPKDRAYDVAWLVANALAAPQCAQL